MIIKAKDKAITGKESHVGKFTLHKTRNPPFNFLILTPLDIEANKKKSRKSSRSKNRTKMSLKELRSIKPGKKTPLKKKGRLYKP